MITIEKEIKYNRFCRPGYHEDAYTDGIQTTVRLFGIPVYRRTETVERVDDSTQADTAEKEPVVIYAGKQVKRYLTKEEREQFNAGSDGTKKQ